MRGRGWYRDKLPHKQYSLIAFNYRWANATQMVGDANEKPVCLSHHHNCVLEVRSALFTMVRVEKRLLLFDFFKSLTETKTVLGVNYSGRGYRRMFHSDGLPALHLGGCVCIFLPCARFSAWCWTELVLSSCQNEEVTKWSWLKAVWCATFINGARLAAYDRYKIHAYRMICMYLEDKCSSLKWTLNQKV